jgi:hypothetical protein
MTPGGDWLFAGPDGEGAGFTPAGFSFPSRRSALLLANGAPDLQLASPFSTVFLVDPLA